MEMMQTKMQEEVEALQALQKQQTKTLTQRQQLDSQVTENKLVKEELDALEEGAGVFKLVGPALVRQDTSEARQNVDKRIEYISGELKRHDELLKELEGKQDAKRESLQSMQSQMQKLAQA